MTATCIAIDVGGTKVAVGRVAADGTVVATHRIPTAGASTGDELFDRIVDAVGGLGTDDGDIACGVGTAGPVHDAGDAVSPLNIPVWDRYPLRSRLENRLGLPAAVEMDGLAIARAEGWVGAAAGCDGYVSLVVSTGVGGGVVVDGRLLRGRTGNAGHVGHVNAVEGGRPCVCGGRGCLEAEVSGWAVEAQTGQPASHAPIEVRERCGRLVGRAAGELANLLDLELVTVSGGVALGFGAPFFDAARAGARETATLSFARDLRIEPSTLGEHGPLLGAAAAAFDGEYVRSGR